MVAFLSSQSLPTLFIHGHASNAYTWSGVISELSPYGRCYPINLKGHGGVNRDIGSPSEYDLDDLSDDVWDFCNNQGLHKVAIIAHSMGSRIAVAMAAKQPERVLNLMLLDMEMEPRLPVSASEEEISRWRSFRSRYSSYDDMKNFLIQYGYSEEFIEEKLKQRKILQEENTGDYITFFHPYTEYLTRNFISTSKKAKEYFQSLPDSIHVKLLVAERDSSVSSEGIEWMKVHHKNFEAVVVAGSDHKIHKTAKGEFLSLAREFMMQSFEKQA